VLKSSAKTGVNQRNGSTQNIRKDSTAGHAQGWTNGLRPSIPPPQCGGIM